MVRSKFFFFFLELMIVLWLIAELKGKLLVFYGGLILRDKLF